MLAKAIPVVIAIVLIIALVGIFYGETLIESVYYTSEREDLYQYFGLVESDDVAMIMQDANIDEKAKLVDGNCYFDMATVEKMLLPSLAAMAEVQWSANRRDEATIRERMESMRKFYEACGWNCAPYYFDGRK